MKCCCWFPAESALRPSVSFFYKGSAVTSILLKQEALGIFYALGYDTQVLMFKHFA